MGALDGQPSAVRVRDTSTADAWSVSARQCIGWNDSEGRGRCIVYTDHPGGLCNFCRNTLARRPDLAARLPLWWRERYAPASGDADASDVAVAAGHSEAGR